MAREGSQGKSRGGGMYGLIRKEGSQAESRVSEAGLLFRVEFIGEFTDGKEAVREAPW